MDKIAKLTPLISALLIFSGYIDYASYYRQFHIPIVNYLSTTELLLSFLAITGPILFLILLISIYIIIDLISISHGTVKENKMYNDAEQSAFVIIFIKAYKAIAWEIKNFTPNFHSMFTILINLIAFALSLSALAFFIVYFFIITPFLVESNSMAGSVLSFGFPLSIIWFMLLLNIVITAVEKIKNPISMQILLAFSIVSFLSLITIYNKQEASYIIKGNEKYQVSLSLEDKVINTDSSFLFVGKTEKYFFFYDKKNSKNVIYPIEQATSIHINLANKH